MSDLAREIAIRHCPGESELPLSAHSRAVWIDALTDAIRAALAAIQEKCAQVADESDCGNGDDADQRAAFIASAIRALKLTETGE